MIQKPTQIFPHSKTIPRPLFPFTRETYPQTISLKQTSLEIYSRHIQRIYSSTRKKEPPEAVYAKHIYCVHKNETQPQYQYNISVTSFPEQ